jgi:hypothetical protein
LPGGVDVGGNPSVARNEDNTLEVFVPDASGHVYHDKQKMPDGEWGGWSELGGDRITNLVSAANADSSLSVFGIGANGDVWIDSQSAPGVGWSGWKDIPGQTIQPGFTVAQDPDGRLEVFGVDRSGNVLHNQQTETESWSGWRRIAGKLGPRLAVGRDLDGRLELFGIEPDGRVMHNAQRVAGGQWGGWSPLGRMKVGSDFVVGQYSDGRLALFDVGTKSLPAIWSISQEIPGGPYGNFHSLGGKGLSQLVVGNDKDGHIQLFGIRKDDSVWTACQTTAHGGWSAWTRLANGSMTFYPDQVHPHPM